MARRTPASSSESDRIPPFEWMAAALGFLLVAGTVAFMAYRAWTSEAAVPAISLQVESVQRSNDRYLVVVAAVNVGEATAADVRVQGSLEDASGTVEVSETRFDYLPPRSKRKGGLFFTRDPALYTVRLRPLGYQTP